MNETSTIQTRTMDHLACWMKADTFNRRFTPVTNDILDIATYILYEAQSALQHVTTETMNFDLFSDLIQEQTIHFYYDSVWRWYKTNTFTVKGFPEYQYRFCLQPEQHHIYLFECDPGSFGLQVINEYHYNDFFLNERFRPNYRKLIRST